MSVLICESSNVGTVVWLSTLITLTLASLTEMLFCATVDVFGKPYLALSVALTTTFNSAPATTAGTSNEYFFVSLSNSIALYLLELAHSLIK